MGRNLPGDWLEFHCPHCEATTRIQAAASLDIQSCRACGQEYLPSTEQRPVESEQSSKPSKSPTPPEVREKPLGSIRRYVVVKLLGKGAYGVVYKAWDPHLHRWVAIKVPRISAAEPRVLESLLREARTSAKLRHPRIVQVYDVDVERGHPYIVSEFVDGETLEVRLGRGPLPPRLASRVVGEVASALHYAHGQGVIHRDVKPGNIMLDPEGHARVMDFGLALLVDGTQSLAEGSITGTPLYLSPEQARGEIKRLSGASDQYSLGIVFYETLTGQRPFQGGLQEVFAQISTGQPREPRELDPSLPETLNAICRRMLAGKIEDRFPSLELVAKSLMEFLRPVTPASVAAVPETVGWWRDRRAMGLAGGVALAVAAAGLGLRSRPEPVEHSPASVQGKTPEIPKQTDSAPPPDAMQPTERAPDLAENPSPTDTIVAQESPPPEPREMVTPANSPVTVSQGATSEGTPPTDNEPPLEPSPPPPEVSTDTYIVAHATNPEDAERVQSGLVELLSGEPGKSRENELHDKLQQCLKLQELAPNEPRIPLTIYVLKRMYRVSPKPAIDLPNELTLLEQARDLPGYRYPPACMSLIHELLGKSTVDLAVIEAELLALAGCMGEDRLWPDRAEKLRVVSWMGSVFGFYLSGISGYTSRDGKISALRERVVAALPADLQPILLEQVEHHLARIQDEFQELDDQAREAIKAKRAGLMADAEARAVQEGELAQRLVETQLQNQDVKKWFEDQKARLEPEYEALHRQAASLKEECEIAAANLQQRYAEVQYLQSQLDALEQQVALKQQVQDGVGIDPIRITTLKQQLFAASSAATFHEKRLQSARLRLRDTTMRGVRIEQEAASIERQYHKLSGDNTAKMQGLNREMGKLTAQADDAPDQLKKLSRQKKASQQGLKTLGGWDEWSYGDVREWLIDSLQPAPKT